MLTTIDHFRIRVAQDRPALIGELQSLTGRFGSEEANAWDRSLVQMNRIFQAESFKPLHLYFGSRGHLSLEYQLPASSSWCDVVLLGAHQQRPAAVIVELKDWQTGNDQPGSYEGLMFRQGAEVLHPSDQVRGYTEYCRRFHSAVQDHAADVYGCVLFTRDPWTSDYEREPNARLVADYPLFTTLAEDIDDRFPAFFRSRLTNAHEPFARAFETGTYRQQRGFVAQIGAQILEPGTGSFELLDGQRRAFAFCRREIERAFHKSGRRRPPKRVVIVKGPPGSGKSAIAARLWAALVTDTKLPDGNVVLTTTSSSQNRNWSWLMERASRERSARGVVKKATSFTPLDTHQFGLLRAKRSASWLSDAELWRENLQHLRTHGIAFRDGSDDNANLVSIVDEAHALINPEHSEGRGQYGFVVTLGPQAYHIIRSSLLSVFLLDPLQGFRSRENTSLDNIRQWSVELGAGTPIEVSLEGMQFRSAGSTEYVSWVESLLSGADVDSNRKLAASWHERKEALATGSSTARMRFDVFSDPESWEEAVRSRVDEGHSARLLSSFSRPWKTRTASAPHDADDSDMDFYEPYRLHGKSRRWSRIWNFVPRGTEYTWFVAGHPASRIAHDPLCEVGCPYAVRGFDYDYIGILWLDDLLWRDGRWVVDPDKVEETGIHALKNAALRELRHGRSGPAMAQLLDKVQQAYRILLTRALRGVYVWIPDDETREHVSASLGYHV